MVAAAGDTSGPDVDDPDAKADGPARPVGLYDVVTPAGGFDDLPHIEQLDLRSDGTYYDYEVAPVDGGDGNIEQGVSETFGTHRFTKDSRGHRFVRFKDAPDPDNAWRWRFALVNGGTARLISGKSFMKL